MPHWEEMQVKAKTLIEEALKVLKAGASEAEHLAGTTASAAKLHMTIKRSRIEKYRLLHEVGNAVYEKVGSAGTAGNNVELSKQVKDLIGQVKNLDDEIDRAEKKLSNFSVVSKTKVQKSAVKKKSPPGKRAQ